MSLKSSSSGLRPAAVGVKVARGASLVLWSDGLDAGAKQAKGSPDPSPTSMADRGGDSELPQGEPSRCTGESEGEIWSATGGWDMDCKARDGLGLLPCLSFDRSALAICLSRALYLLISSL